MKTTASSPCRVLIFALVTFAALWPRPALSACSTPSGVAGDIIFNGTYNVLQYCNGTSWVNAGSLGANSGTLTAGDFCTTNGSVINCTTAYTGTGNVVLSASPTLTGTLAAAAATFSGSVAGAASTWTGQVAIGTTTANGALNVSGTLNATTFSGSGSGLTGIGTSSLTAITGAASATTFLRGDGSWASLTTAALPALTSTNIWVGNGSNAATPVALSGDCTLANTGAITCTKTGGSSFGALATAASVNLATQVSGGLSIANGGTNSTSQTTNGVNYFNGTNISSGSNLVYTATGLGIGTATPLNTLTVNGTHSFLFSSDYTTTGAQSDVALNTASSIRYNGASAATFYGIVAGTNGQVIYLHNASSGTLTVSNQSGSEATAANKVITGTGADLVMASNSSVILQYDLTAARWRVIGSSGAASLTGGVTNEVPLWTSATTIGTSNIYQSGSNIGIGTATSTAPLHVYNSTVQSTRIQGPSYSGYLTPGGGQEAMWSSGGAYDNGSAWIATATSATMAGPATSGFTVQTATGNTIGSSIASWTANLYVSSSTGYVGISTTTPDSLLTVNANTSGLQTPKAGTMVHFANASGSTSAITVDSFGTGVASNLLLRTAQGTGGTPTASQSGDIIGAVQFTGYGATGYLSNNSGAKIQALAAENFTDSTGAMVLAFNTRPTASNGTAVERMRIDQNGNVGIGVTSPAAQLHLYNATNGGDFGIGKQGDTTPYMRIGMDTNYYQFEANNAYWTGSAYNYVNTGGYGGQATRLAQYNGTILFDTASGGTNPISWNNRMYISNAGNVGIGSASPTQKLDVNGAIAIGGIVALSRGGNYTILGDAGGSNAEYLGNASDPSDYFDNTNHYFRSRGGGTYYVTINGSGNVGIGTTTPTAQLTVATTQAVQFGSNYTTTGTQNNVAISGNTTVRYTGAGAATFNGIVAGANGQLLYLHNDSTSTLTLANQASADTTVANQIVTGTGSNLSVSANAGVVLQYDVSATNSGGATGAWRVVGATSSGSSLASCTKIVTSSASFTPSNGATIGYTLVSGGGGMGSGGGGGGGGSSAIVDNATVQNCAAGGAGASAGGGYGSNGSMVSGSFVADGNTVTVFIGGGGGAGSYSGGGGGAGYYGGGGGGGGGYYGTGGGGASCASGGSGGGGGSGSTYGSGFYGVNGSNGSLHAGGGGGYTYWGGYVNSGGGGGSSGSGGGGGSVNPSSSITTAGGGGGGYGAGAGSAAVSGGSSGANSISGGLGSTYTGAGGVSGSGGIGVITYQAATCSY